MRTVAALYIDPRGPYPSMPGVECWDEKRDACLYDGPHPVVAHPPCGPWGKLRHLYGGQDRDCALRAVEQVRAFGGALEHPAGSKLWEHCKLPMTSVELDRYGGFSLEVEQVAWGHVARKKTWLYLCGIDRGEVVRGIRTGGTPTHWLSGGRAHSRKGSGGFAPPGIKICSAQQRRRTPPLFAAWLVSLARMSTVAQPEAACSAS